MQLSTNLHNAGIGLDARQSYDLCRYVAEFIQFELYELKKQRKDITADMVAEAVSAYLGGAR